MASLTRLRDRLEVRSALVYTSAVVVAWQLAYLADRVLPIPNSLVAAIPIVGVLGLPLVHRWRLAPWLVKVWKRQPRRRVVGLAALVVAFVAVVAILQGPVYACGEIASDCHNYVDMVDSIAFDPSRLQGPAGPWPEYGSHHFMRIVPPLLVRAVTWLGVDVDSAFRIVSAGAYALFAGLMLMVLLRMGADPVLATGFTLLIAGVHSQMTFHLRDVYRATDALTYPLSLGIIVLALQERWRWVFLLGMIGIATKQNLFVLSTLALAYLAFRRRGRHERIEIFALLVISVLGYLGLSEYYHATETVAMHFVPGDAGNLLDATIGSAVRNGLLTLFLPLVALVSWYGRDAARMLVRRWFVGLYVLVGVAQPVLSYTTAANLERVALQGVWPVYLVVAFVACRRRLPAAWSWLVLAYGVSIFAHRQTGDRLVIVGIMTAISTLLWLRWRWPGGRATRAPVAAFTE